MITTVCKISYGSQTVPPIVPAVQGDTGRAISFEIADFTPPAGATATYFILKPSGEAIYNSATITDNSILCELTAQSLAEAGENRMQVRVLQGEDIVTSFEVILMVRTFLGDDAIQSGTEMNIFDQAVEQATEQFQENAEQIVAEVIESIPADYTELTEEVGQLNERLDTEGLSEDAKVALLDCFEHVAWIDEHGQDYYDALEAALYPETGLVSISAVFTQGSAVIYSSTPINDLKAYLVVTGYYNNGTSKIITDYSLSGALEVGTSTITVSKEGKTTTFNVTVTPPYWDYIWEASSRVIPEGMTYREAEFVTRDGEDALRVFTPYLDFNHVGDCICECNIKPILKEIPITGDSEPQIVVVKSEGTTGNLGAKLIFFRGSGGDVSFNYPYVNTGNGLIPVQVDATTQFRTYTLEFIGNTATMKLDGEVVDTGSGSTSEYNHFTGISTLYMNGGLEIKSIKIKKTNF